MPTTTDADLVWHYTSAAGLYGIVESNTLMATSAAFMNDAMELRSGVETLRRHLDERRSELGAKELSGLRSTGFFDGAVVFDTFLLSASQHADSLTMWRNYGGDAGIAYAIGLDRNTRLVPLALNPAEKHPNPPPDWYEPEYVETVEGKLENINPAPDHPFSSWQDVKYISGWEDGTVRSFFDQLLIAVRASQWVVGSTNVSALGAFKDAGFHQEAEVRYLLEVSPSWKFAQHRPSRFGLVPYVRLVRQRVAGESWADAAEPGSLPIQRVMIGPGHSEYSERSLRWFLDDHGYGDVQIKLSATPYR